MGVERSRQDRGGIQRIWGEGEKDCNRFSVEVPYTRLWYFEGRVSVEGLQLSYLFSLFCLTVVLPVMVEQGT